MKFALRLPTALLVAGLALAACSSDKATGDAIPITSTDTECRVAQLSLPAGTHSFQVENAGGAATEVYVYAKGDKVVAEKENVGPGTKATFSAKLAIGEYQIACKPGQKGTGIRQTLTVT